MHHEKMIFDHAKRYRNFSTIASLGVIIGLLGFGVTGLNEWWANYQYNALKQKSGQV
jgi:hypothetical protein